MIHTVIYVNGQNKYVGFRACGHAGYAEEGEDIVCSAASVLMINTVNAVELYTGMEASLTSDEESGMIDYRITGELSREAELLLKTMVLGLSEMTDDDNYAEYIDLTFEEV